MSDRSLIYEKLLQIEMALGRIKRRFLGIRRLMIFWIVITVWIC